MDSMKISMILDNNYVFQTCITIVSLLENGMNRVLCDFYFLVGTDFSEKSRDEITRTAGRYREITVHFIVIKSECFSDVEVSTEGLALASYYRLLIAEVVGADKCIYLDGDVLVLDDLYDLWDTDLGENYIAGVKNWGYQTFADGIEMHRKAGGLTSMDQYVNAGVLILNLKKIREDHMTEIFRRHMKIRYVSDDQDILNVCCYGKIKILPLRYNLYNRYIGKITRLTGDIFGPDEKKEAEMHPAILHFASSVSKPWKNIRCLGADKWWEYARLLLTDREYEQKYEQAVRISAENDFHSDETEQVTAAAPLRSKVYYASLAPEYFALELEQVYLREGNKAAFSFEEYRDSVAKDKNLVQKYFLEYWLIQSDKTV